MGRLHVDELLDMIGDSDLIYTLADAVAKCISSKGYRAARRGDYIVVAGVEDEDVADMAEECLSSILGGFLRK